MLLGATALVALSVVPSSGAAVRWFLSPHAGLDQVGCEVASKRPRLGTYAECQTARPQRAMTLHANGVSHICRGLQCVGNSPTNATVLAYGHSVRVGPFRCTSLRAGIRCVVTASGHGFLIGPSAFKRF